MQNSQYCVVALGEEGPVVKTTQVTEDHIQDMVENKISKIDGGHGELEELPVRETVDEEAQVTE